MFTHLNPPRSDFGDIFALHPLFLHQLIMQSTPFRVPGHSKVYVATLILTPFKGSISTLFKVSRKVGNGFYSTTPDAPDGQCGPPEFAEVCLHVVF